MTTVDTRPSTLPAEQRAFHAAFTSTLYGAVGDACSPSLRALGEKAGRAHAAALCEPGSPTRWTTFVQAVFAFLDELDARIGIAVGADAVKSRHELRDIIYENADLLAPRPICS